MLELVEAGDHSQMRGMQMCRAQGISSDNLRSHPGGLSRQEPILPGESETGQGCPDPFSRSWELC